MVRAMAESTWKKLTEFEEQRAAADHRAVASNLSLTIPQLLFHDVQDAWRAAVRLICALLKEPDLTVAQGAYAELDVRINRLKNLGEEPWSTWPAQPVARRIQTVTAASSLRAAYQFAVEVHRCAGGIEIKPLVKAATDKAINRRASFQDDQWEKWAIVTQGLFQYHVLISPYESVGDMQKLALQVDREIAEEVITAIAKCSPEGNKQAGDQWPPPDDWAVRPGQVAVLGSVYEITGEPYGIIEMFVNANGRSFTRDSLMERLVPDEGRENPDDTDKKANTLRQIMSRTNRRFKKLASVQTDILVAKGRGRGRVWRLATPNELAGR